MLDVYVLDQISQKDDLYSFLVSRVELSIEGKFMSLYLRASTSKQKEKSDRLAEILENEKENFGFNIELEHRTPENRKKYHPDEKFAPKGMDNHIHLDFSNSNFENKLDVFLEHLNSKKGVLHPDLFYALKTRQSGFSGLFLQHAEMLKVSDDCALFSENDFGLAFLSSPFSSPVKAGKVGSSPVKVGSSPVKEGASPVKVGSSPVKANTSPVKKEHSKVVKRLF